MSERQGFYYDLSFEEYAADPALNASKIVNMRRSAMYYKHMLDNPSPETPALALGKITHRMILEPDTVGEIVVWGKEDWQKVRNGKKWEDFQAEHEGKTILTSKDYDAVLSMSGYALDNKPIRHYAYAPGRTEVSMFWVHPGTGKRYKARLDKLIVDGDKRCIPDLKTTRDSRPWKFGMQAHSLGYVIKMAHYWNGYRILTGIEPAMKFLAIESKAPHESVVYDIPRDLIVSGLEELDELIWKIAECEKTNTWPPQEQYEVELTLPAFASAEADTELGLEL